MNSELHSLIKHYERLLIKDGPLSINISVIRKTLEQLKTLEKLTMEKDKDSSHHQDNRKKLRDLFNLRYQQKAMEISGRMFNDDGKPIYPRWDIKSLSLLKLDYSENGFKSMSRYIELFFSDEVDSVADFTRKVNKAGYSYTIFHTVIPKLAMSNKNPAIPCPICGLRKIHSQTCPHFQKMFVPAEDNNSTIIEKRSALKNIPIQDMFKDSIRRNK